MFASFPISLAPTRSEMLERAAASLILHRVHQRASTRFHINLQVALVLAHGAVMAALVWFHVPGINGPWYWKWAWRRLPVWPYYALMIVAAAPVLAGLALHSLGTRAILVLPMMMIGVFAMKLS